MFVELIIFKSKPGITDDVIEASANKIQALAAGMGVPFKLELLRTADGEWVEIVRWPNQEEAQRVEQVVMGMQEAQDSMSVMDEASMRMMFLYPVKGEAQ
jgi:hypothetical protein